MKLELQRYGAALRKWGWLLVLGAIGTAAVAYGLQFLQAPVYAASSSMLVGSLNASRSTPITREQDVLAALTPVITSDAILTPVAQKYPPVTVAQIRQGLRITAPNMHNVLAFLPLITVTVQSTDATTAEALANGVVNSFVRYEIDGLSGDGYTRLQSLQATYTTLTNQITQVNTALQAAKKATPPDPATIADLKSQLEQLQTQATLLQGTITELQDQLRTDEYNLHITQTAQDAIIVNRDLTKALLGALIGGVAALGLVVLFEFTSGRIDRFATVEREHVTPLAALPVLPTRRPLSVKPQARIQQSFEQLRTRLDTLLQAKPGQLILLAGDGAARADVVALLLCQAYGATGKRVLLIDANSMKPQLHEMVGLPLGPGFAEVLTELGAKQQSNSMPIQQVEQMPNVGLIAAGNDLSHALQGASVTTLRRFERALATYKPDLVILTANGLPQNASVGLLATACQGSVIVVDAHSARISQLRAGLRSLQRMQSFIYGVALYNMIDLTENYGVS